MLKQLWCWIRTGHKDKKLFSTILKPKDYSHTTITVEKKYICKNCGKKIISQENIYD